MENVDKNSTLSEVSIDDVRKMPLKVIVFKNFLTVLFTLTLYTDTTDTNSLLCNKYYILYLIYIFNTHDTFYLACEMSSISKFR